MEIVPGPRPRGLVKYITSTDHKQIGLNYLVTSFIGFLFAGLLAEGIRTQLIVPNNTLRDRERVQPAVHDARHDHAVRLPRAVRLRRPGQLPDPADDRGARHGLPPLQQPLLLVVPRRLPAHVGRLLDQQRRRQLRMVRLRPAHRSDPLPRPRRRPVDPRRRPDRLLRDLHRRQHHHDHLHACAPRAWSCSACPSSCGTSWSPCS